MAAKKKKKNSSNGLRNVAIVILLIGIIAAYKTFGPATGSFTKGEYLYIHTGADYGQMTIALQEGGFISDMFTFGILANVAKLPAHIHPGRYRITEGMSNYNIIRMLRSGRQSPVKIVINRLRRKQDLVTLLCSNLEADSTAMHQLLQDNGFLSEFGLDTNTAMCAILPDTYDFFWNTSSEKAFRKIARNYTRFWDDDRKAQAKAQSLSPVQVMIIASIVDEETNMPDDKPKIASVYINRYHINMRLQADPTIKFAVGDFTIRRVAGPMLQNPSPYNTYLYAGLPPGPICTPSLASVEAVLHAPRSNFLYFCAKDDFSGHSVFASSYDEQIKNARAYQKALDARGIH